MMKNMKQILNVVLPICVVLAVLVAIGASIVQRIEYLKSGISAYEIDNFKQYRESFDIVADKLLTQYSIENEKNIIQSMMIKALVQDKWNITCVTNKNERYTVSVTLSDEEKKAYAKVSEAFQHCGGLYFVKLTKDQVAFACTSVRYAVIRVNSSSAPKYLLNPDETYGSYFRKLSGKWYQGIETNY